MPGAKTLFYEGKSAHHDPLASHPQGETLDILEFLARVLTQSPEPRTHGVRYFGAYSSKARAYRKKANFTLESLGGPKDSNIQDEPQLSLKKRAALRKSWAQLIKRVYQTDPLKCECGGTLLLSISLGCSATPPCALPLALEGITAASCPNSPVQNCPNPFCLPRALSATFTNAQ